MPIKNVGPGDLGPNVPAAVGCWGGCWPGVQADPQVHDAVIKELTRLQTQTGSEAAQEVLRLATEQLGKKSQTRKTKKQK